MSQPGVMDTTVKERAGLALNDDFLRKAVKFTTERCVTGRNMPQKNMEIGMNGVREARQIRLAYDCASGLLFE